MSTEWKKRLIDQSDLQNLGEQLRAKGKKISFTAGAWDMLHVGQARYLAQARQQGDILVVGLSSNAVIKQLKGPNKPIFDEMIRAEMLTFLKCVDFVTIIPIPSCQPILALLKPDVYVTVKEDWNDKYKESKEYKTVIKYGGKVEIVQRQSPFISTTTILEKVVGSHLGDVLKNFSKNQDKPLKEK